MVEWNAPAECPNSADIALRVKRAFGDVVTSSLAATVKVTQTAGKYRAKVQVASAEGYGERILEHERCEILADSVALVIALSAARANAGPASGARSDELGLALSAHATAVTGPLPRLALGAGGSVGFEGWSPFRLELGVSYHARQTITFDRTDVGGRFSMLRVGARACRIWSIGSLDLAPCLGGQLYRIEGAGFGGLVHHSGATLVWGAALGGFGRIRLLSRLAVLIAADGVVALARQRFVYSDAGLLHEPSLFVLQVFVAPEVRF